jgi:hypothetical protein
MTTFHRTFKAKRTEYEGVLYDSIAESRRAMELDLLQRAGKVAWWVRQVTFRLGCPENTYRVDFVVAEPAPGAANAAINALVVHAEDVKSIETREFARHKRLWAKYGIMPLHVIKRKTVEIVAGD